MSSKVNYRRQLLRIVEAFLGDSPSATQNALNLLRLPPYPSDQTLGRFIWSPLISALGDSRYSTNLEFLQQTREGLAGRTVMRGQACANYDYRSEMSAGDLSWYHYLASVLSFIRDVCDRSKKETYKTVSEMMESVFETYNKHAARLEELAARSPSPRQSTEELIYRFVLREITTTLVTLNIAASLRNGYPVPGVPYALAVSFDHRWVAPDASYRLAWAERALQAISGGAWIFFDWQLKKDVLMWSLH